MKNIRKIGSAFLAATLAGAILTPSVFAATDSSSKTEISDVKFLEMQSEADNFLSLIENELSLAGTNVVDELENQTAMFTDLLSSSDEVVKEKLVLLIETTNQLIDSYTKYENGNVSRGIVDGIYFTEIAAGVAYFEKQGYDLAAELLTYATANNVLDSYYSPTLGYDVRSSDVYSQILNSASTSGSAEFAKTGNVDDNDLHYAINKFNYRKSDSGRVVVIEDRYDFEQGATGSTITKVVLDQMYKAQEAGVLVPYYTYIVLDNDRPAQNQSETVTIGNSISTVRMYDKAVTLGKGEYKDFTITFATSGYKLFQTFGDTDTSIEIFNSSGTSLTNGEGDDYGYFHNAMIKYYCTAGTKYKVRVKFYSSDKSGDTRFTVTPASNYKNEDATGLYTYGNIFKFRVNEHYLLTSNTILNQTAVVTFTVEKTGKYDIQISSDLDTYIYVIDPRSSREWKNHVDYNDDDGVGSNPKISNRELASGVPYLIVYSGYNIEKQENVGDIKILIDKV